MLISRLHLPTRASAMACTLSELRHFGKWVSVSRRIDARYENRNGAAAPPPRCDYELLVTIYPAKAPSAPDGTPARSNRETALLESRSASRLAPSMPQSTT